MTVTPYLSLQDANAAIAFYVKAFGAEEQFRLPGKDGKIMHAVLAVAGAQVFLSDAGPAGTPGGVSIALGLDKAADVDTWAARFAAAGGTITHAPEDMFWGDRFAELRDPFGHTWLLDAPKT
jgi:PhnB protein